MIRKIKGIAIILLILLLSQFILPAFSFAIDAHVLNGRVVVSGLNPKDTQKLTLERKENGDEKPYNINNETEILPLSSKGEYTIEILKHEQLDRYRVIEKISIKASDVDDAFLHSSQPVYFKETDKAVHLVKYLTSGKTTDIDKLRACYDYIVKNIKYDKDKINRIDGNYVPNSDLTVENKSGICYDYAALLAVMLRSQGIKTKLVKGYKNGIDEYHAWNEVFINGKWFTIDTTFDAAYVQAGINIAMIKNSSEYTKTSEE